MRIVLLLLPLLSSCIFGHYTSERRHQLIQSEYALTDTLHITNVFLCNSHRIEEKNVTEIPTDLDSIFSMFQSSLTRLNLPIQYHDIEYHCDEDLLKNYMKKVSKIDTNKIIHLASKQPGIVHLIPIIYVTKWDKRLFTIGARFSPNASVYRSHHVTIIVYIIKNERIIYSRKFEKPGEGLVISIQDPDPLSDITQKHWDKLVRRTMRAYVKNLK